MKKNSRFGSPKSWIFYIFMAIWLIWICFKAPPAHHQYAGFIKQSQAPIGEQWKRFKYGFYITDFAAHSNTMVAVGDGILWSADNGIHWQANDQVKKFDDLNLSTITYGEKQFVVMSDGEFPKVLRSADGKNWKISPFLVDKNSFKADPPFFKSLTSKQIKSIHKQFVQINQITHYDVKMHFHRLLYGNKRFIVFAQLKTGYPDTGYDDNHLDKASAQSLVFSSTDGIHWRYCQPPEHGAVINDAIYAKHHFIIIVDGCKILTSTDGVVWHQRYSNDQIKLGNIFYRNGQVMITVTGDNRTQEDMPAKTVISVDGLSWKLGYDISAIAGYKEIETYAPFNSQFAWNSDNYFMTWSRKKQRWIKQFAVTILHIAHSDKQYVAVGPWLLLTSSDGQHWHYHRRKRFSGGDIENIIYSHGYFVLASRHQCTSDKISADRLCSATVIASSDNGIDWKDRFIISDPESLTNLYYRYGKFIITTQNSKIKVSPRAFAE